MLLEILCQRKSFQKYWIMYVFCFVWILFFLVHGDMIGTNSWIAYGVPVLVIGLNTVIVLIIILKINHLVKTGKRIKCKIVHSMYDFNNGVLRIRCNSNLESNDDTYQFEEKVMVPFAARSPEIDSIYKNVGSYLDMQYIDVLVNPVDYSQYEILYFELLSDESRKSKYSLMVMGALFLVFVILLTKSIDINKFDGSH